MAENPEAKMSLEDDGPDIQDPSEDSNRLIGFELVILVFIEIVHVGASFIAGAVTFWIFHAYSIALITAFAAYLFIATLWLIYDTRTEKRWQKMTTSLGQKGGI